MQHGRRRSPGKERQNHRHCRRSQGAHGAEMLPESDNDEIVALLGKVSMALAIQSLELRSVLRKAVSQQHLESGDIELF